MLIPIFLCLIIVILIAINNSAATQKPAVDVSSDKQKVIEQLFAISEKQSVLYMQALGEKDKVIAQKDIVIATLVDETKELMQAINEIESFSSDLEEIEEEDDDEEENDKELVPTVAASPAKRTIVQDLEYLSEKSATARIALELGTQMEQAKKIIEENKEGISPDVRIILEKVLSKNIC